MAMSKTEDELLDNDLWSASKFLPHFKELRTRNLKMDMGRTCLHLHSNGSVFKLYPHYNGRTNEWVTLVLNNTELANYHYSEHPKKVVDKLVCILTNVK